ncbi:vacuolar protein-sorting-associated protein 36-like [Zophobas morio]|uniref:vacuolar protein-sorting-associated protein 36-like n=1 Tax=Zophobas morio TaxID=2755281 RepID=UPI003083950D
MEAWEKWASAEISLVRGENLLFEIECTSFLEGDQSGAEAIPGGTIKLTSHRLFFRNSENNFLELRLSKVQSVAQVKGSMFHHDKIIINVGPPFCKTTKLFFRNQHYQEFYKKLLEALENKTWALKEDSSQDLLSSEQKFFTERAGIYGLVKQKQREKTEAATTMTKAFTDLSALISNAQQLVSFAEKLKSKISRHEMSADDQTKFKRYLSELGVVDPVGSPNKLGASQYYRQLAKELVTFVIRPLEDHGGMLTLTHIFCLYNKARGHQLVSPDDLLEACKAVNLLNSAVVFKTFASGTKVLQLKKLDEEEVLRRISSLFCSADQAVFDKCRSFTIAAYSLYSALPVALAKEQLLLAEQHGILCRDDSLEGLTFYPNLF